MGLIKRDTETKLYDKKHRGKDMLNIGQGNHHPVKRGITRTGGWQPGVIIAANQGIIR